MTEIAATHVTAEQARELEARFLARLEDAQYAYEQIVATSAWTALGFDSFASWWDDRVRPVMHALSMRPTREIAAAVIEQVRQEEEALPSTWRRTQQQLGEMVGISQQAVSARSSPDKKLLEDDLERSDVPESLPARQEVADEILRRIDRRAIAPLPPTEWAEERAQEAELERQRRVATHLLCQVVHPLSQMRGTSTFTKYEPAEALPGRLIDRRVIEDAMTALEEMARVWKERELP